MLFSNDCRLIDLVNRKKAVALSLSLFVFPGFGHLYLKEKVRGLAISLLTSVLLLLFICHFEWSLFQFMQRLETHSSFTQDLLRTLTQTWEASQTLYLILLGLLTVVWGAAGLDLVRKK